MLFVCEVEKQRNVIHVGVVVAANFLLVEGQAPLRSSGINAARICYLVICDLIFVSCLKNFLSMREVIASKNVNTS